MTRLARLARAPEIAVPTALLVVGVLALGLALVVIRPDPAVASVLLAGVIGVYGTVISLSVGRYYERQRDAATRQQEREREIRAKQAPEYEAFVAFLMGFFMAEKTGRRTPSTQDRMKDLERWTRSLVIWGSDDVVSRWGRLRLDTQGADKMERLFDLEQFLFALRRDVAYPDTALARGDLLRLWVNDIDSHIPPASTAQTMDGNADSAPPAGQS